MVIPPQLQAHRQLPVPGLSRRQQVLTHADSPGGLGLPQQRREDQELQEGAALAAEPPKVWSR